MVTKNELTRIGSGVWEEVGDTFTHPLRTPYRTVGLLLVALGVVGFIWVFPELRRYMRMKRM